MKHNFGAGPCILPQEVFKQAADAVLDFNGLSILEVSHRHKDYVAVMDEALDLVKKALNVPAGYSVAYLQGGASLGFTTSSVSTFLGATFFLGFVLATIGADVLRFLVFP